LTTNKQGNKTNALGKRHTALNNQEVRQKAGHSKLPKSIEALLTSKKKSYRDINTTNSFTLSPPKLQIKLCNTISN